MINAVMVPVEWLMARADAHTYVGPLMAVWALRALWIMWTDKGGSD